MSALRPRPFGELLAVTGIAADSGIRDIGITGISDDSRTVQRGDLYLALRGTRADGRDYIAQAVDRGAVAVLAEADDTAVVDRVMPASAAAAVPVIAVRQLRALAGPVAATFFGEPARALAVLAVTGTNGKTTTSWLLASALDRLGRRTAVLGTLGVGATHARAPLRNTTPGAVELQQLLAGLRDAGFSAVAMEASSIGIAQHRLAGMHFEIAIFTNISRDHLDYHGTMAAYAEAKAALFSWPGLAGAVLNADDVCAVRWLAEGRIHAARVLTYGTGRSHDIGLLEIVPAVRGMTLRLVVEGHPVSITTPLIGDFNAGNVMAVVGALRLLGYETDAIVRVLGEVDAPAGRMETFGGADAPLCVVDYAHTPDALEKTLSVLRARTAGSLWCVFGCGGNRDSGKRAQMGEVAARLADQVIVTSDNPRDEDPRMIIDAVVAGIGAGVQVLVEPDRARAIAAAITAASISDVVLIAGKGHEDYQEIAGQRLPFSDQHQVQAALVARAAAALAGASVGASGGAAC